MSIVCFWLGTRMLMDVGTCASGGPYEIQQECPDGASLLLAASIPVGLCFGVLMLWGMGGVSEKAPLLTFLSWPALYLSLAWNFFETGGILGILCGLMAVALASFGLYLIKPIREIEQRRLAVFSILFTGVLAGIVFAIRFVDLID